MRLGDRLAYNNGIVLLSIAAALVFVAFGGLTGMLIPLYAVGVFLAFTLSQTGMVLHWWRLRNRHWRKSLCFNAVGPPCGCTRMPLSSPRTARTAR